MKIGIITLPIDTNYGGILQAYALQTILKRMGHDTYLITKNKLPFSLPIYMYPLCYGKRILKNLLGQKTAIFYEQKYQYEQKQIKQYTSIFINKYIKQKKYNDYSEINPSEYDAIVVGSDQVWRPQYFGSNEIEQAYLQFAKEWNIIRVAYAASFGTDVWEYTQEQTNNCKQLLKKFDFVSVRELSAISLCKENFGVKAQFVLDPTMLLDKEDYIQLLVNEDIPKSSGSLFCYILDETAEKKQIIENVAETKSLTPFSVRAKTYNDKAPLTDRIQPPVEQWLRGFADAEFVVTDSFHGCVFSIIFNKPFIAIGNKMRGQARFESLLNLFNQKERLIHNKESLAYKLSIPINWDNVNSIREDMKITSMTFLSGAIK